MAQVIGLDDVIEALRRHANKWGDEDASVVVGYTQSYAVYVHENLEAVHPVGQAKFLEQPARELNNNGTLGRIVVSALRKGWSMAKALTLAGLKLQAASQELCPVDTGALKNSAFTRLETK